MFPNSWNTEIALEFESFGRCCWARRRECFCGGAGAWRLFPGPSASACPPWLVFLDPVGSVPGLPNALRRCTDPRCSGHTVLDRDLFLELPLPDYDVFQKVRITAEFRFRLRFELRLAAKFSRTLRRHRICEHDPWTEQESLSLIHI